MTSSLRKIQKKLFSVFLSLKLLRVWLTKIITLRGIFLKQEATIIITVVHGGATTRIEIQSSLRGINLVNKELNLT